MTADDEKRLRISILFQERIQKGEKRFSHLFVFSQTLIDTKKGTCKKQMPTFLVTRAGIEPALPP